MYSCFGEKSPPAWGGAGGPRERVVSQLLLRLLGVFMSFLRARHSNGAVRSGQQPLSYQSWHLLSFVDFQILNITKPGDGSDTTDFVSVFLGYSRVKRAHCHSGSDLLYV